tara:strand:- start:657 stop:824 length:168 start_codon:yes stop_codon:yes gene_type:complete
MDMIPATKDVENKLDHLKKGMIISIKDSLIRVQAKDGWIWQSSTTRGGKVRVRVK